MKKLLWLMVLVLAGCSHTTYARTYAWNAVTQNEDGSAVSNVTYKVYYQTGTNLTEIGQTVTTNFTWKPASGVYTVVVTAVSGFNESDGSVPLVDDARKPGKPTGVTKTQ